MSFVRRSRQRRPLLLLSLSLALALVVASATPATAAASSVSVAEPAVGATVPAGTPTAVTGQAWDDRGVGRVAVALRRGDTGEWLQPRGGWGSFAWVEADLDRPGAGRTSWRLGWTPAGVGDHLVIAQAWDDAGAPSLDLQWVPFSVERTSADAGPPAVSVTSPSGGATVDVGTLAITGTASDDAAVATVDAAVRDARTGSWLQPDGSWGSFAWLPATLASPGARSSGWRVTAQLANAGDYGLTARVADDAGNHTPSAWVSFHATSGGGEPQPPAPPPPPSSGYGIGSLTVDLFDSARGRHLPTTVHYPSRPGTGGAGAPAADGPFPVVVAGHGSGGTGAAAASLHDFLPPAGYVVAAPTFPAGYDFTAMARDVSFVLDELLQRSATGGGTIGGLMDGSRVGYIGTSMGGMTGLALYQRCCLDPRVDAVVVKAGSAPYGSYDWASGPALLMIHGTADTTVTYAEGRSAYASAGRPKAFVSLSGVNHNFNIPGGSPILRDAPLGFFDRYLRGDAGGLDRLRSAVNASPIASLEAAW